MFSKKPESIASAAKCLRALRSSMCAISDHNFIPTTRRLFAEALKSIKVAKNELLRRTSEIFLLFQLLWNIFVTQKRETR